MPRQRRGDAPIRAGHAVESFRFGLALHVGTVLYGNIGGGNRLDFTCIGPAVNLAARLEKIAEQPASHGGRFGEFRGDLRRRKLVRSRRVSDRRVFKAQRVYGLADETALPSS